MTRASMTDRNSIRIASLAPDDRPREKMMAQGPAALSNAELLAILIGSGTPKESAVALMQRVMTDCANNLNTLGKMSIADLMAYKGIGTAKAITLLAACELGKRRQGQTVEERPLMKSAEDIYRFMHPRMQDLDVEEAWVLLMNQRFQLIKAERISRGGFTETAVDVRVMIKSALLCNATVIALCHNHPSGSIIPSNEDNMLTKRVGDAAKLMRIHLLDHLVITDGCYYSYQEHGKL